MSADSAAIYQGHRARMRDRLHIAGAHAMASYELLEMLLYFPISRRDTHPAAKRLLLELGGISGVLSASVSELSEVEGVGEETARFLEAVARLVSADCLSDDSVGICDTASAAEHFVSYFRGATEPSVAIASLDNSLRAISTVTVSSVKLSSGALRPEDFIRAALSAGAARVLIGAVSPHGTAIVSDGEREGYRLLKDSLERLEIPVLAGVLVSGDKYARIDGGFSMPEKSSPKRSCESETHGTLAELLRPLLTYTKDKDIGAADRLAASFKTKEALFSADERRLEAITGSRSAAELLRLIAYLASRAVTDRYRTGSKYKREELEELLKALFVYQSEEALWLLSLSATGVLLSWDRLASGTAAALSVSPRTVAERAFVNGAERVIMAHNHPAGDAVPSEDDTRATKSLAESLALSGICLEAHYVVAGGEVSQIEF